jgi:hypothetical protein
MYIICIGKEDNLENQKMAVSVTGHSLGGAVSCMLAGVYMYIYKCMHKHIYIYIHIYRHTYI